MTDGERLALDIIRNVRAALGTPDEMHVEHHAAQVAAELQLAREDLQSTREALHDMAQFINRLTVALAVPDGVEGDAYIAFAAQVAADAAQWRAVPWGLFEPTTRIAMGDFASWSAYDEAYDLRTWYDRSKPKEVTA